MEWLMNIIIPNEIFSQDQLYLFRFKKMYPLARIKSPQSMKSVPKLWKALTKVFLLCHIQKDHQESRLDILSSQCCEDSPRYPGFLWELLQSPFLKGFSLGPHYIRTGSFVSLFLQGIKSQANYSHEIMCILSSYRN